MVKYKLFFKEGNILRYYYYVFGSLDLAPGIIEVNLEKGNIEIITPAPDDSLETISVEFALVTKRSINKFRKENGKPKLTENEFKTPTKDEQYYVYGLHAMDDIRERINKNEISENGTVAWC